MGVDLFNACIRHVFYTIIFKRNIQHILTGIDDVVNLLDDNYLGMGYYGSLVEHDKGLQAILERLELHEVVFKIAKCLVGLHSIEFGGHLIKTPGQYHQI